MIDPKFSIVIPVYNGEGFIENCLDSVINQTYQNYEIIIINDGSEDNTDIVIKNYLSKHQDIVFKYILQNNQGAAIARGTGINMAEGDFIALLDADDIWYSNKLETNALYIQEFNADVYYNNEVERSIHGEKKACIYYQLGKDPIIELITGDNPISTSTTVIEANFMKSYHSFFDGIKYGEDIACWISLAKAGARFKYIPEILGEYIRQEKSLTMNNMDYTLNTYERLISFCDELADCGYSQEEINQFKKIQSKKKYYNMARFYHRKKEYKKARENYKMAMKLCGDKKTVAGYGLAMLHICK